MNCIANVRLWSTVLLLDVFCYCRVIGSFSRSSLSLSLRSVGETQFELTSKQWKRRISFDHLVHPTNCWWKMSRFSFLFPLRSRCRPMRRTIEANERTNEWVRPSLSLSLSFPSLTHSHSPPSTSPRTKIKSMCSNVFNPPFDRWGVVFIIHPFETNDLRHAYPKGENHWSYLFSE